MRLSPPRPAGLTAIPAANLATSRVVSDVLVVGSGVAGLTAALGLLPRRVTLLTKTELMRGSNSHWAQGGVAAALAAEDSPADHAADTLIAGAGLSDGGVVGILTREGPERIRGLIELGARFDRDARGGLRLGREGAHRHRRILHAGGDATGAEMVRALVAAVRRARAIDIREHAFVQDLVLDGDRVVGVLARHPDGSVVFHRASAVVLASGGLGQLYARTTNPPAATGDGLAVAARAGARLADLELVQFHPTALEVAEDPLPLVTEALRGEGARLLDETGERFMVGVHPRAELAPRDIVARAIWRRRQHGHGVFLDATECVGRDFPRRFPTVWASCLRSGLDPRSMPIPVTPAAHYAMAGVAVDESGRSSLPGLWACGETASNGVHGANRLASNSLLDALVFGSRVADDAGGWVAPPRAAEDVVWREPEGTHRPGVRDRIRRLMWNRVGLVRDALGLELALEEIEHLAPKVAMASGVAAAETANLLTLAWMVTVAALDREESRGAHYRADFPVARDEEARRRFWTYPGIGLLRPADNAEREIA